MGVTSQWGGPQHRVSAQEHGPVLGQTGWKCPRGHHATAYCTEWTHAAVQGLIISVGGISVKCSFINPRSSLSHTESSFNHPENSFNHSGSFMNHAGSSFNHSGSSLNHPWSSLIHTRSSLNYIYLPRTALFLQSKPVLKCDINVI